MLPIVSPRSIRPPFDYPVAQILFPLALSILRVLLTLNMLHASNMIRSISSPSIRISGTYRKRLKSPALQSLLLLVLRALDQYRTRV